MKVLIGYDGSEHSDAAIDDLRLAGLPRDCEVMIASIGDLLMSSPDLTEVLSQTLMPARVEAGIKRAQSHAEQVTQEATEAARRAKELVTDLFPEWNVRSEVLIGTPAWVLIDLADKWGADLVVVGSQGKSGLQRLFLGSVSKRVVTDAHVSVRVARPSVGAATPRLLVCVDGSPAAEQAIYTVGKRVWPADAEALLLAVDDGTRPTQLTTRLPRAAAMINDYLDSRESRVAAMLEWGREELNNIGLTTAVETVKGDAKTVILEKANEWNATSIFVGTRDLHSAFERLRLGSVSTSVVTSAQCSVEVVRPREDEQ